MAMSIGLKIAPAISETSTINIGTSGNLITTSINTQESFLESTDIMLTSIVIYGMFGNFGNIVFI